MKLLRRLDVKTWAGLLGGLGAILIAGGGLVKPEYAGAVMLELGAALFLAIPLVLLEHILERVSQRQQEAAKSLRRDLHQVTREVQEARDRIEELDWATKERIAADREADVEAGEEARENPSEPNVWRLLTRAHGLGATDPRGLRVQLPGSDLRMRFAAVLAREGGDAREFVATAVERADGEWVAGPVNWALDQPAAEVLSELAAELQAAGQYPGDDSFDASAIFTALIDALDRLIALRTGRVQGARLPAVVEVQGDWALTVEGLAATKRDGRSVPARLLLTERELALEQLGDGDAERDRALALAMDTAVAFHSGRDREAARERLSRG